MARARQTAESVAARVGLPITFDRRFREIDTGDRDPLTPEAHRERAGRYLKRTKVYTSITRTRTARGRRSSTSGRPRC